MNIVCIGAHPDDCEVFFGGTAIRMVQEGHKVVCVSLTNGSIGHHEEWGETLVKRRRTECALAASIGGYESVVLDHDDGTLLADLALREETARLIRMYEADIVVTHRPCDYHPDHRNTSVAVQDAAYLVCVPGFCPETPILRRHPVFLHLIDIVGKPPFEASIVVDIDTVMPTKWALIDAMESQMYEWLPWMDGVLETVPADKKERRTWLESQWSDFFADMSRRCHDACERRYGTEHARGFQFVEGFELCTHGRQVSTEELEEIMPF